MADARVHVERRGRVAVVTLDRPERKNTFGPGMWDGLERAADELHAATPRVVVLTGTGGVFSAGMDVNPDNPLVAALVSAVQTGDAGPCRDTLREMHRVLDRVFSLPVPLIAAVNGLAYGGGVEIAARCDLRVADPTAVFCSSEVRLGLMPDWGGTTALARLLGPARAADLILTARKVPAEEALALGLVNRVSAPGRCLDDALALAEQIAANGPRAVRAALSVLRRVHDLAQPDALALELETGAQVMATGECQIGVMAFMSRRQPEFPD